MPKNVTIRAGASTEHKSTSTGKSVLEYNVFSVFMFIILGKTSTRVVLAPALVTIELWSIMRIFYELRYTIIELVRNFNLQGVLKHISWVISRTSLSKLSCNPRHPSRNISCNHRHHLMQPSWRRIFSTSNNQKTRVVSDVNSNYKASSFDRLYIWRRKSDTVGFLRAHQRKYWNALSPAAMMMMVAAATIIRFHPVI